MNKYTKIIMSWHAYAHWLEKHTREQSRKLDKILGLEAHK